MSRVPNSIAVAVLLVFTAACNSRSPTAPDSPGSASPSGVAPSITAQPSAQTVTSGQSAVLSVAVTGDAPLTFQWYVGASGVSTTPATGATSASYATPALTASTSYWVRVSNGAGAANSATAVVTVMPAVSAPLITAQPQNQTVGFGQAASLSVGATGTAPLDYTWFFGAPGNTSVPVPAPNTSSINTPGLTASTSVWVRVSNAHGSVDSAAAAIAVLPDPSVLAFEDAVLVLVNQQRAAGAVCGGTAFPAAPPLSMNGQLRTAARAHSEDMAAQGYFSHTSLDGRTFDQRIHNAGYLASPLGENIAAGYPTAQAVVAGWMASPGHCSNIMSGSFRAIGVGYASRAGSPFGQYWTQDFGGS